MQCNVNVYSLNYYTKDKRCENIFKLSTSCCCFIKPLGKGSLITQTFTPLSRVTGTLENVKFTRLTYIDRVSYFSPIINLSGFQLIE